MQILRQLVVAGGCALIGVSTLGIASVVTSDRAYGACGGGGGGGLAGSGSGGSIIQASSGGGGGSPSGGGGGGGPAGFNIGSGKPTGSSGGGGGGAPAGGTQSASVCIAPAAVKATTGRPDLQKIYEEAAERCKVLAEAAANSNIAEQYKSNEKAYQTLAKASGGGDA